jgi:hypothetical protein
VTAIRQALGRVRAQPRRFVTVMDALFVAMLMVAVAAELAVDFRTTIIGIPLSIRSVWRVVAWALLLSALRHFVVPRPSFLQRILRDTGPEAPPEEPEFLSATSEASLLKAFGLLSFFAVATALLLWRQVAQFDALPDQGDPLFSVWRLSWVSHQLPRAPLQLFEANIFHPHPHTLAYSDSMLVPSIAAAPLLWLGVHQVTAYNVVFLSAIVLSGVTMFMLVELLTGRGGAALISGLLFSFCAFRLQHYSHLELQVAHWMPLALYGVHRVLVSGRIRDGLLAGGAIGLQALSSFYYGVYFVTALTCMLALLWLAGRVRSRSAVPLLAGAALAAAIVVPAAVPYVQSRNVVGERDRGEVESFSAMPADYLVAHERSVYRQWLDGAAPGERQLFPGVVPLALTLIALWPPLGAMKLAYGAGLVFAFDASLGFNGEAYHWLYDYVPGLHGFRAPARFAMIVAMCLSVLAGYGIARILGRLRSRVAALALVLSVGVLAFAESAPALRLEPITPRPPAVYDALPRDRKVVLAELPFPASQRPPALDCRYMYFSTFHWHKLVNGNSGFFPPAYEPLRERMEQFPSDDAIAALRRYGVEFVVVHEKPYGAEQFARVTAALEQRPEFRFVARDVLEGGRVELYELTASPESFRGN